MRKMHFPAECLSSHQNKGIHDSPSGSKSTPYDRATYIMNNAVVGRDNAWSGTEDMWILIAVGSSYRAPPQRRFWRAI